MHGFYYAFQAIFSAYTCVSSSQLIKPSTFSSLWTGYVSVRLFLWKLYCRIKIPFCWQMFSHSNINGSQTNKTLRNIFILKVTLVSIFGLFYVFNHVFSMAKAQYKSILFPTFLKSFVKVAQIQQVDTTPFILHLIIVVSLCQLRFLRFVLHSAPHPPKIL